MAVGGAVQHGMKHVPPSFSKRRETRIKKVKRERERDRGRGRERERERELRTIGALLHTTSVGERKKAHTLVGGEKGEKKRNKNKLTSTSFWNE